MAFALKGSVGAFTTGTTSVSPPYGQTPVQGNLLILWIHQGDNGGGPTVSAGWTQMQTIVSGVSTLTGGSIWYRQAAGGDAAPSITYTSGFLAAQVAEFTGWGVQGALQSPVDRTTGVDTGTATPATATAGGVDVASGELILYFGAFGYSAAATKTITATLNNGATANSSSNNATSVTRHALFGWGITTGKASADNLSIAFTTTKIVGSAVILISMQLATLGPGEIKLRAPLTGAYHSVRGRF